jgi:hypothetical protein
MPGGAYCQDTACGVAMFFAAREKGRKDFFSEEKKQKTFIIWAAAVLKLALQGTKVFGFRGGRAC